MAPSLTIISDLNTLAEAMGVPASDLVSVAAGSAQSTLRSRADSRFNTVFGGGRFATGRFGSRTPKTLLQAISMLGNAPDSLRAKALATDFQEQQHAAGQLQPAGSSRGGSSFSSRNRSSGTTGSPPPGGQSPEPSSGFPDQTAIRTRQPQGFREEQQFFSEEIRSPESSNVYSFQFYRRPGEATGILYVTYKASRIDSGSVSVGAARHKGGRRQLRGRLGRTVKGKMDGPGPTYAYFGVPANVFTRMQSAASKGKFVWDTLRIRGTVYGHRYRYQLYVGQLMTVPGGGVKTYVPRVATKGGFKTRSVVDTGTGRRGFTSSTLPAQSFGSGSGFSSRRR